MQYFSSIIAGVAFATIVTAQIPVCAVGCIADAVEAATTCGAKDLVCHCTPDNVAKIQGAATPCVIEKCGSEAISVIAVAQAACASVKASGQASSTTPAQSVAPYSVATTSAATTSAVDISPVVSTTSPHSPLSMTDSHAPATKTPVSSEANPVTLSTTGSSNVKPSISTSLPYLGTNGTTDSTGLPQVTGGAGNLAVGLGTLGVAAVVVIVVM
ncbi:hypothetical protein BJ875DRAFT_455873 [Amylocarpus encephaloides]|uniref:CFEM domain-containing protein n=1 Tax=Amylocarpus encephaloides TaxID=45428 RepID=A0A9P7YNA8_9HELO|nr:hypothetical protein BJ875DRAFT_455873 [Amylocarpus encephaloides]